MLTKTQNNVISYTGAIMVFFSAHAVFLRTPQHSMAPSSTAGHAAPAVVTLFDDFYLTCALWSLHFSRRALESAFLEKHAISNVPLSDSLAEFAYYWMFAVWIAYSLATQDKLLLPLSFPPSLAVCGWVVAELTNCYAHITLSRAPAKQEKRTVPASCLFCLVCCPHYLCEILSWLFFSLCCPFISSVVFTSAGAVIMTGYALERHRKYAASDPSFAKSGRKAIFPYVL
jgi:very-long-chain enoyl-CoA reductase